MYSKFLKLIKTNKYYDYNCYATLQKADISENKTFNRFFEAVKSWNWKLIDKFVNNGANINACLVITGPQAGYTALHFACIDDDDDKALKLLDDYEVNVNSVSDDGAQPLHLACLLGHERIVNVLLDSDANPDVEFSKKIHEKYAEFGERWSDDFGGKMTLLTFAVINNDEYLTHRILKQNKNKANILIRNINNKTLLMYAVENDNYNIVHWLLSKMKDYPELINARDSDGFHVLHYLLPNEKFGQFRYHQKIFFEVKKGQITAELIDAGADIYATVNGNPDTLLLNMAAYRSCLCILKILMNFDVHLSIASKALCNATLPIDPTKYMRIYRNIPGDNPMEVMEKERKLCIEYILQNLVIRRRLRLFVPEEEKKLMDQLIAMELDIQEIVSNYEEEFIRGFKNEEIYYGGKSINLYELMVEVFHDRTLKQLVKDNNLVEAYKKFSAIHVFQDTQTCWLIQIMDSKITRAHNRRKLLGKIEKIRDLKEAIPLPYEIILDIIEYIDNYNLKIFIDAFYENSVYL